MPLRRAHNGLRVPFLFVFILLAPEGALHTRLPLEPGRRYGPEDIRVERGEPPAAPAHRLTVTATCLPAEDEFRALAARAATRTADDSPDELRQLLRLLIPF